MKGIFRKDLYFIMQNQKAFLLCIGIFTVSWVLQAVHDTDSTLMSAVIFLYGAMLPHILLTHDTQSHFLSSISAMPVTRRQYLGEKYLLVLAAQAIISVFGLAVMLICDMIAGKGIQADSFADLLLCMCVGLLFPAVNIPVWTLLFDKGKAIFQLSSIIMGACLGAVISIAIATTDQLTVKLPTACVAFALSAALFGLSYCIASAIFLRKDIR